MLFCFLKIIPQLCAFTCCAISLLIQVGDTDSASCLLYQQCSTLMSHLPITCGDWRRGCVWITAWRGQWYSVVSGFFLPLGLGVSKSAEDVSHLLLVGPTSLDRPPDTHWCTSQPRSHTHTCRCEQRRDGHNSCSVFFIIISIIKSFHLVIIQAITRVFYFVSFSFFVFFSNNVKFMPLVWGRMNMCEWAAVSSCGITFRLNPSSPSFSPPLSFDLFAHSLSPTL